MMRTFMAPALVVFGALFAPPAEAGDQGRATPPNVQVRNVQVRNTNVRNVQVLPVQVAPVQQRGGGRPVANVNVQRVNVTPVGVARAAVSPVVVQRVSVQNVSGATSRPGATPPPGSGSFGSDRTTWDLPVELTIAPTPVAQPKAFNTDSMDLATGERLAAPPTDASVTRGSAATPQLRAYDGKSIELWTTPAPRVDEETF